ncbi:helix-turn-helix domain-containing protein [Streptomyces sp. NPDC059786]|uniref:helix-turn-helix domain-containing protein n=1 Tax=Streptomyces sp. NPDC059786 TaxID=3346946 RepID=UPI003647C72E
MPYSSLPLGGNVRALRRAKGFNQERLAEVTGLAVRTIQKIEGGGHARMETLRLIAQALGASTTELFTADAPEPVVGDERTRQVLAPLRQALMPPIGLTETLSFPGTPVSLADLRQRVHDGHTLYHADSYQSVARDLPGLLRSTEATVASLDGEEREESLVVRASALLLAGKYLTQVRQYDMAYHALSEAITIGRESGKQLTAATGVIGMCWLLLRQDRFDESEQLAAVTAEQIEPRMTGAPSGQYAAWGELSLRIASAAIRNNRPDEAKAARRMADSAAGALGREHIDYTTHWTSFGPVTAALKEVEDRAITGDWRGVLSHSDQDRLSPKSLRKVGKPSTNNWDRHRLDVAKAHVKLGSTQDAMNELMQLREHSGHWLKHQPMARYVMTDLLKKRQRPLTMEMREMAAHLGVRD